MNYQRTPLKRCGGKVCYDKRTATTAKNLRWKEDHVQLRIYPCPYGPHWHLTHLVNDDTNE